MLNVFTPPKFVFPLCFEGAWLAQGILVLAAYDRNCERKYISLLFIDIKGDKKLQAKLLENERHWTLLMGTLHVFFT